MGLRLCLRPPGSVVPSQETGPALDPAPEPSQVYVLSVPWAPEGPRGRGRIPHRSREPGLGPGGEEGAGGSALEVTQGPVWGSLPSECRQPGASILPEDTYGETRGLCPGLFGQCGPAPPRPRAPEPGFQSCLSHHSVGALGQARPVLCRSPPWPSAPAARPTESWRRSPEGQGGRPCFPRGFPRN